jgi:hypothetical protein
MFDAQKRSERGIFLYVKSEKNVDRGPALCETHGYSAGWGYLGTVCKGSPLPSWQVCGPGMARDRWVN